MRWCTLLEEAGKRGTIAAVVVPRGESNTKQNGFVCVPPRNNERSYRYPPIHLEETLDATQLAAVFDACGDPTRVKLLQFVLDEEHCVTQCTEHIGLTQSAVSKHLAKLTDAGLVARRPEGRRAYYRATKPEGLLQIFADARLLAGGGPPD